MHLVLRILGCIGLGNPDLDLKISNPSSMESENGFCRRFHSWKSMSGTIEVGEIRYETRFQILCSIVKILKKTQKNPSSE